MIVVPVNQRDLRGRICQPACGFHSAKPRADDDNVGECFGVHENLINSSCNTAIYRQKKN